MKKPLIFALLLGSSSLNAAVLQSFTGPYVVTGGNLGTLLVDNSNDTGDWIDSYTSGSSSVPLYVSFTMTVTDNTGENGGGGFFAGLHLYTGSAERLLIGNEWFNTGWSVYDNTISGVTLNANPGVGGLNPITPGETGIIVMRLDQATDSAKIWFNPNFLLTEGGQDVGLTTAIPGLGNNDSFDGIYLRAGNGTGSATYNNISFRTDSPFATVPETSTAVLSALGAVCLLRRRRE